jgi:hypothetical protein
MKVNIPSFGVLIVLGAFCPWTTISGQGEPDPKSTLQEQRKRLAGVKAGTSAEEVLKILGKPDEVRRIPEGHLLDGFQYMGEKNRWVYGILGKGKFAKIGFVSMDGNDKVVTAIPADWFANPDTKLPTLVPANGELGVESPAKMSFHMSAIKIVPAEGEYAGDFETSVTLKNTGTARFELKHDAAYAMRRFILIEVYDAKGTLLFRENQMRYHSPIFMNPADWFVLSVPAGKEMIEGLYITPAHGFGQLPAGKYAARVYFPIEKGKYYPSNLVSFQLK